MIRAEQMDLGQVAQWFFGAAERWPMTYDAKDLGQLWTWGYEHVYEHLTDTQEERRRRLVETLRAGLLKRARSNTSTCTACPLSQNRLPGRPVFDDGDVDLDIYAKWENNRAPIGTTSAEIMVIGEGPGAFEQRTGFPFVSYQGLAGASACARGCTNYFTCFNDKSKFPQGECKPQMIRKQLKDKGTDPDEIEAELIQIRTARANTPVFPIQTAGNRLDQVLFTAGLWREVWNAKAKLQGKGTKPGSVYVTNVVKCRSCDASGTDATPNKAEMEACYRWLELQLYIIQPKVIVALGNPAAQTMTGTKSGILSIRGQILRSRCGEIPVVVDVHPSYIIRLTDTNKQKEYTQLLIESFELAKKVVAGEVEAPGKEEQAVGTPLPKTKAAPEAPVPAAIPSSFQDDEDEVEAAGGQAAEQPEDTGLLPSTASFITTEPEDDEDA